MAGRLDGVVAIVTGGARGQGAAEARLFVREGARVVIADVLDAEGEMLARELGADALFVHMDVSSEQDWSSCVTVAERLGPVRVLVNNAAVVRFAALEDTTLEEYMRVVAINQVGTFLGMRSVIEPMRRAGGGSIVNISSIDGIGSKNGLVSYSSTKGAVRAMTKTAALELGRFAIRVNSVHPGGVYTPMFSDVPEAVFEKLHRHLPLGRAGRPEEIAALVLFLASEDSSYCTGSEFVADGGWLAGDINPELPGANKRPGSPGGSNWVTALGSGAPS